MSFISRSCLDFDRSLCCLLVVKFTEFNSCIDKCISAHAGIYINHISRCISVIPLPLVKPPLVYKLPINTCSIIKLVDNPPQYLSVCLTMWNPWQIYHKCEGAFAEVQSYAANKYGRIWHTSYVQKQQDMVKFPALFVDAVNIHIFYILKHELGRSNEIHKILNIIIVIYILIMTISILLYKEVNMKYITHQLMFSFIIKYYKNNIQEGL